MWPSIQACRYLIDSKSQNLNQPLMKILNQDVVIANVLGESSCIHVSSSKSLIGRSFPGPDAEAQVYALHDQIAAAMYDDVLFSVSASHSYTLNIILRYIYIYSRTGTKVPVNACVYVLARLLRHTHLYKYYTTAVYISCINNIIIVTKKR